MNKEKILQKVNELSYRIDLNKKGLEKAEYNLKFAHKLGLTQKQIDEYVQGKAYYKEKLAENQKTYNCLEAFAKDNTPYLSSDYLFKCTMPYNKVDNLSGYQTSIVVDDSVVGIFANGVNYKDVISCLEPGDIYNIESKFISYEPTKVDNNVYVEVVEEEAKGHNNAVISCNNTTKDIGLISFDNISECYSDYKKYTFKDLNGNVVSPYVPSLDDILLKQSCANAQEKEFHDYKTLETQVVDRINKASDKMSFILDKFDNN